MNEIVQGFIQVFEALHQGVNEMIEQATKMGQELLSHPMSVEALFQIIQTTPNEIYKHQAANLIKRSIVMHRKNILENPIPIIQQSIIILSKEQNFEIQRLLVSGIDEFIPITRDFSFPLIIDFLQKALASKLPNLINASIHLCMSIGPDLDSFSEYGPALIELTQTGLSILPPIHPLEFAFFLGNFPFCEENDFFKGVWMNSINLIMQNINDVSLVNNVTSQLNGAMDIDFDCEDEDGGYVPPFVNPSAIVNAFLPVLGDPNVNVDSARCLIGTIVFALSFPEYLSSLNYDEFFPNFLQKLFHVSAMSYNPEDSLSISGVDVFQAACSLLADDEFDGSDQFVSTLLQMSSELIATPEMKPGVINALYWIFDKSSDLIVGSLDFICELLARSVQDESRLVRDSAAEAIGQLVVSLEDEIEDYIQMLSTSVLQSLHLEASKEMLSAFCNVLSSSQNTDPIFEQAYMFLMNGMSSPNEEMVLYYFPCLIELCINSKTQIRAVFNDLIPLMFKTIEQGLSDNMVDNALSCLAYFSTNFPELFAAYVPQFVQHLMSYLNSENDDLVATSLNSFGKLLEHLSAQLNPVLNQLVQILLGIGSKNMNENLAQEVLEYHQSLIAKLEETGEVELEVDDDEDDHFSGNAIPSLALKVYSRIAMHFPQIIPVTFEQALNDFQVQMDNRSLDSIDTICEAISLLSFGIAKSALPPEAKNETASRFCNWTLAIINDALEISSASKAMVSLGEIIDSFSISVIGEQNQPVLLNTLTRFLEGKLKCQNSKNSDLIKELNQDYSFLVCQIIASLGPQAPTVLDSLIQKFISYATSSKIMYRDMAIKIFGQLSEHSSESLSVEFKQNAFRFIINGIRNNSQIAAFALDQFTNYNQQIILESINEVMQLIFEKLTSNKKKSNSYTAFIDNLVAALGEIRRNVLMDQFPVQQFAPIVLPLMPANNDSSTNLDMMTFFVWLATVLNMQPVDQFAAVGIRLFMRPNDEIGTILEDDSGILNKVTLITRNCLNAMGPAAKGLIESICENDPIRIERVQNVIGSVKQ